MRASFVLTAILVLLTASSLQAASRLEQIRARGSVTCGVEPIVPGFAEIDPQGRYRGLDVDVCRALAAAIFGTPDKVRFVQALAAAEFVRNDDIDVVARRLTWELRREAPLGLLFGPITFYDGQGFLVSKTLRVRTPSQLAGTDICVAGGTVFELNLNVYFAAHSRTLKKTILESPGKFDQIAAELTSGRCRVYTADVSELGAIRYKTGKPEQFDILSEQISKEPLAPLVRADDPQFFTILRWTFFALVRAEELGITSKNVDDMRKSPSEEVQRLLGVIAGNGEALGLRESWAYDTIKAMGNYGEMFDRNVGRASAIKLDRGLNKLSSSGGLMFAPPLR
jgi:general L-amino acid transport system substrate-binding protein